MPNTNTVIIVFDILSIVVCMTTSSLCNFYSTVIPDRSEKTRTCRWPSVEDRRLKTAAEHRSDILSTAFAYYSPPLWTLLMSLLVISGQRSVFLSAGLVQ